MNKQSYCHYKWLIFSLLIMLGIGCKNAGDSGKQITLRLEPSVGNPRNSEGDFVQLIDGRILFIYTHFTQGSGDNAGAYLAGRYSQDGGRTWSSKDVLIVPNEGDMNVMSVSLLRLDDGRIALFYLRKNSEVDCIPYMRISTDEAQAWSAPQRCIADSGYFVMNNDRVIQLQNGRILLPVSLHNTPETERSARGRIMCYYSDDNAQSWQISQEVPNPDEIIVQEPGIIRLKNGDLMMFCRSNAGVQYITFSKDDGQSWSAIQPSNIKSPLSPASIERIPSTGDLLLVWNDNYESSHGGGKRTPFNLAISRDDGKTWERQKTLESNPDGWYCYTAIEFIADHVLLAHCAGDRKKFNGLETTQITRLSSDWVYSEATPEPYVLSDNNGMVILECPAEDAEIRYTLDRSMPSRSSLRYEKPIRVSKTTPLCMQAWQEGRPPSNIVSVSVGINVYQNPPQMYHDLKQGLAYAYYEGAVQEVADIEKHELIESSIWSDFSIKPRKREENFAFIFSGYIRISRDGIYTFYLSSNDGSKLYLNDEELIYNDGPHGEQENSNAIALRTGRYPITLKYFQTGGEKALKVSWQGPQFNKTEIPDSVLFH